jgi:hypothetical protein
MTDVVLITKGQISYGVSKLVSGDQMNNYMLVCVAMIYDSLNAK